MVGPVRRFWKWFWRPSSKYGWGAIFIVGGIAGIVFWGGFNTFMEYTNTLEFCVDPTGGKLEINGQDAGYVPTRLDLSPGTYDYKVVKEGYEPLTGKVTIPNGGNPLINGSMTIQPVSPRTKLMTDRSKPRT